MQAISNPVALELSREARKTIMPNDFVRSTLSRDDELAELKAYGIWLEQKSETRGKEKMILMALQNDAPFELVDIMRADAGITDARFAELKSQVQHAS